MPFRCDWIAKYLDLFSRCAAIHADSFQRQELFRLFSNLNVSVLFVDATCNIKEDIFGYDAIILYANDVLKCIDYYFQTVHLSLSCAKAQVDVVGLHIAKEWAKLTIILVTCVHEYYYNTR